MSKIFKLALSKAPRGTIEVDGNFPDMIQWACAILAATRDFYFLTAPRPKFADGHATSPFLYETYRQIKILFPFPNTSTGDENLVCRYTKF